MPIDDLRAHEPHHRDLVEVDDPLLGDETMRDSVEIPELRRSHHFFQTPEIDRDRVVCPRRSLFVRSLSELTIDDERESDDSPSTPEFDDEELHVNFCPRAKGQGPPGGYKRKAGTPGSQSRDKRTFTPPVHPAEVNGQSATRWPPA